MFKHHSKFLKSLLFLFDLVLICGCWIGAYYLRLSELFYPAPEFFPPDRALFMALAADCLDLGGFVLCL